VEELLEDATWLDFARLVAERQRVEGRIAEQPCRWKTKSRAEAPAFLLGTHAGCRIGPVRVAELA
jgi:hypothetical protein